MPSRRRRSRHYAAVIALGGGLALVLCGAPSRARADSGPDTRTEASLALAEAAFARGDCDTAGREYAAVLAIDPEHPRALFRLAQIRRTDTAAAVSLLRTYVRVEPSDPWGYLALANALADAGSRHADEALRIYEEAAARAPTDRDIALGRPRLLVRLQRIDDAIDAYDSWLIVQREDSEAWQELADARHRAGRWKGAVAALTQAAALDPEDVALQRRLEALRLQLAPAIEVGLLGVGETDIATAGFLLGADVAAGDGSRLAVGLQQRRVSSFDGLAHTRRLGIRADLRPRADLRLQLTGGPVWLRSPDAGTSATRLELGLRMRRSLPGQATLVDVRAQHGPVDVSPELVRLELSRTQVTSTIQQVVGGPWRLRMVGRLGVLGSPQTERTVRTGIGGGPAIALAPGVGISGRWQQTRHHNPGATGYFAPRLAEVVDAGLDIDRDYDSVSIGLDAGAGLQRFERHGEAMGRWTPALRLWSFVAWSLTPGHQVLFEAEGYRSQVAEAVIARDAERWHYASASVSLRVSLR